MYFTRQAPITLLIAIAITTCAFGQDTIQWHYDLSQAPRLAEQQQRLVLLHFWSDNCAPCQRLEANVFNEPLLIRAVTTSFIPVKINVQQQPKIASYYKVDKFPTDIIVLPNGKEVFRTVSPQKANSYIAMLDQVRATTMQHGLQEINQLASNADRLTQRATQQVQQFTSALPALPARSDEDEPSSQSINNDLGALANSNAGSDDAWRSSGINPGRAVQDARSAIVNNEFIGPLDRKVDAKPAAPAARQGNPYVDGQTQTPPAQVQPSTSVQAPLQPQAPAQPQPSFQSQSPAQPPLQVQSHLQPQAQSSPTTISGNRWSGGDANSGRDVTPQYLAARPDETVQPSPYAGAAQSNPNGLNVPAESAPQYGPAAAQQRPATELGVGSGYGVVPPRQTQAPEVPAPAAQYPVANTIPQQDPAAGGSLINRQPQFSQQQQPQPPALHPSAPPLALDGFCPVTLMESQKWEQGNPQFGVIHRGRTYLFRSAMERDRFMAPGAADHYAPVLSGYDAVRFAELHQTVEGSRAFGVVYQDQIYLFADEQALLQFEQQPQKYVSIVRQAMLTARNNLPQR